MDESYMGKPVRVIACIAPHRQLFWTIEDHDDDDDDDEEEM